MQAREGERVHIVGSEGGREREREERGHVGGRVVGDSEVGEKRAIFKEISVKDCQGVRRDEETRCEWREVRMTRRRTRRMRMKNGNDEEEAERRMRTKKEKQNEE